MLKFGSLTIVADLNRVKLNEQNDLRCYFVDGNIVKIDKDTNEPDYKYFKRVAFSLGRSVIPGTSLDSLISYSRIYINKLWSHKTKDDETGKKVILPYYGAPEKNYEKAKALESWTV